MYVSLLFIAGYRKRLIPTSWTIFPEAGRAFFDYLKFQAPPLASFHPYDALQQLSYAFIVFILGPLAILTGAAMSPAIAGRFPRYTNFFGGRQKARSLHFLVMVGYLIFIVIHVTMVGLINFSQNMDRIVLGGNTGHEGLAIFIGLMAIALVIGIHFAVTRWSQKKPRQVLTFTGHFINVGMNLLQ